MNRKMTCIECPKGCRLEVETDGGSRVSSVAGHECPRGEKYAKQEVEAPMRTLTSAVLTSGLELKMLPVRTNKPIPKAKLPEAMAAVKRITQGSPVKTGSVIVKNFLGLGVDLVATRELELLDPATNFRK
jgi:CxxC motif-containing protein